jgi:tRNA 2-selenouridine synthase
VLAEFLGKVKVAAWKEQVQRGEFGPVVSNLLTEHYDPGYLRSITNNFVRYPQATFFEATDRSPQAMQQLAKNVLASQVEFPKLGHTGSAGGV